MDVKKTKIIYFITKSVWGGAAKYIIDLASKPNGERFEIYVAAGGDGALKTAAEKAGAIYLSVPSFGREIKFFSDVQSFFEVLYLIFRLKPDIIHVNSSKAGGVCGLAGFIYELVGGNLKMIFTAHGWAFHESRPKLQLIFIRFLSWLTCLFYDRVICISSLDYYSASKLKIAPERKLALIHNGISPEIQFLPRGQAREKLGLAQEAFIIGTIAEWIKNKGMDILFKAAAGLKNQNLRFLLIGSGENPEKEEIYNLVENLKLSDCVSLKEFLPEAAMYLKAFDIFVFPSRKEGLPYALMEAGLAELPIVATDVGGNPDIITNDENGILIPPENAGALKNALENMLADKNKALSLGKKAREKILKEFTLEKMREKTYRLYAAGGYES